MKDEFKFKIGDRVRIIGGAKKGDTCTILSLGTTYALLKPDVGKNYEKLYRNLEVIQPEPVKKIRDLNDRVYEFSVQAMPAIDQTRIAEDLSYKSPIALMEIGGKCYIMIHHGIYNKVAWCDDKQLQKDFEAHITVNPGVFMEIPQNRIQFIKDLVRRVMDSKFSSVAKKYGSGKAKVTLLKV